jgi:hypothetical protein
MSNSCIICYFFSPSLPSLFKSSLKLLIIKNLVGNYSPTRCPSDKVTRLHGESAVLFCLIVPSLTHALFLNQFHFPSQRRIVYFIFEKNTSPCFLSSSSNRHWKPLNKQQKRNLKQINLPILIAHKRHVFQKS